MKLFFDTEFTGLHIGTNIISIGLISEDKRRFYAEITDFDKSQIDDWLQKNVIDNLILPYYKEGFESKNEVIEIVNGKEKIVSYDFYIKDRKEMVSTEFRRWLEQFDEIEFVSDVSHYDFVLLIDLAFKHALNVPENICAACHDINQDIAAFLNISEKEAFNYCREDFIKMYAPEKEVDGKKHNSLYDAEVIKAIYEIIHGNFLCSVNNQ